jgi:hypothetical protein
MNTFIKGKNCIFEFSDIRCNLHYQNLKPATILLTPALKKAGWNLSDRTQIWFEVPVQGYDASREDLERLFHLAYTIRSHKKGN